MSQLLLTDFIRSRTIQILFLFGIIFDLSTANTIKHMLFLFGVPYTTSIALFYWMNKKRTPITNRISEQYRPKR